MNSIISRHYDFDRRPVIRLNDLQKDQIGSIERKIASGDYTMESQPCPCGSNESEVIASRDKFGLNVRNVICTRCGLIRIDPRFTAGTYKKFYETEYRRLYTGSGSYGNIRSIFRAEMETGKTLHATL